MGNKPNLSTVLEKDNLIVYLSILLIIIITGVYTIFGIGMPMSAIEMTKMSGIFSIPSSVDMDMNMGSNNMNIGWSFSMAISMFLMWWLMMIAMMTPSAAPTLLLFHNLKCILHLGQANPLLIIFSVNSTICFLSSSLGFTG